MCSKERERERLRENDKMSKACCTTRPKLNQASMWRKKVSSQNIKGNERKNVFSENALILNISLLKPPCNLNSLV
jgi:hypothetical protein